MVAFDGLALENPENDLFGDSKTPAKHFTKFAKERSKGEMAEASVIKMMNAMNYAKNKEAAKILPHKTGHKRHRPSPCRACYARTFA